MLPAVFIAANLLTTVSASLLSSADLVRTELPFAHFVGTSLLFTLVPAYIMAVIVFLNRSTEQLPLLFEDACSNQDATALTSSLTEYQSWRWPVLFVGILFGFSQNELFIREMFASMQFSGLDVVFVVQSAILWLFITDTIMWRVNVSLAINRFAKSLEIDVLETDRFKPIARIATTDILFVAGAMAFMPLQSLDAEFRIWNYQAGLVVGLFSAIVLFSIPLLGARANIQQSKEQRLVDLKDQRQASAPETVQALELHLAHEDRIRSISAWPLDLNLVTRIIGYVFIPPVAWTGAAIVERILF